MATEESGGPERETQADERLPSPTPSPGRAATRLREIDAERYEGFRLVAQGGMGVVYRALDTDLNRAVAFKVVRSDTDGVASPVTPTPLDALPPRPGSPSYPAFESLSSRFLQEAWVTAALDHPGIVPVYEVGRTRSGVPYYTMRFVRGRRTLASAITGADGRGIAARLALLEPFLKVCDAVRYAHAHGVIHRDLKPENIALGEFGEAVVLDWGLSKVVTPGAHESGTHEAADASWQVRVHAFRADAELRTVASAVGTPGFMSPEAATGRTAEAGPRTDVYSLGAILYRILTGRLPFEFSTYPEFVHRLLSEDPADPRSVDPEVPEGIAAICLEALARDPGARTPSADVLAGQVRAWMEEREREAQTQTLLSEAEDLAAKLPRGSPAETIDRADRLQSICARILHVRPGHARAVEMAREADLHEERAVAEREAGVRARTRRRIGAVALAAIVVLLGVFAKIVDNERRNTEGALRTVGRERDEKLVALRLAADAAADKDRALTRARASGLAQAAAAVRDDDPQRSLLLAIEAMRTEPTREVMTELHDSVQRAGPAVLVRAHDGPVDGIAETPDGSSLLSWGVDGRTHMWGLDGSRLAEFPSHASPVVHGTVSPDGSLVATGDRNGLVQVSSRDGVLRRALTGHRGWVDQIAFSPDGRLLLTAGQDGTARIWNTEGDGVVVIRGHEAQVTSARWSAAGDRVLTASVDGAVRMWTREGMPAGVCEGHTAPVRNAEFLADGCVVTTCDDGRVRTFRPDGSARATAPLGAPCRPLAVEPGGVRFVTGHDDWYIRIWSADCIRERIIGPADDFVEGVRWSATTGEFVTTSWWSNRVRRWSATGATLETPGGHDRVVRAAVFVGPAGAIATADNQGDLRVWRNGQAEILVLGGHARTVQCASYSPDETKILSASQDGHVRVWDRSGTCLFERRLDGVGIEYAAWSPTGDAFVVTRGDSGAMLLASDGADVLRVGESGGQCRMAAFHPSGQRFATASWDGTARLWDLSGREISVMRVQGTSTPWLCFTPDGERMVTAHTDGRYRIWSLDGRELSSVHVHANSVWCVSLSPDGKRLLTTSMDGTGRITDLDTGEYVVLRGHEQSCTGGAFLPDGKRVATVSADRTVRVWDLEGREIHRIRAHDRNAYHVSSNRAGTRLLTSSGDRTAREWTIDPEELLSIAEARVRRQFTLAEREEFADLLGPENPDRLAALRWIDAKRAERGPDADLAALAEDSADLSASQRAAVARELAAMRRAPGRSGR